MTSASLPPSSINFLLFQCSTLKLTAIHPDVEVIMTVSLSLLLYSPSWVCLTFMRLVDSLGHKDPTSAGRNVSPPGCSELSKDPQVLLWMEKRETFPGRGRSGQQVFRDRKRGSCRDSVEGAR